VTGVDSARHIEAVEQAGGLLASAASRVPRDSRVPTCPDWDMGELVRHQGGVHRWATGVVATPHTEFWDVGLDEVVGTWPDDDELVSWFEAGCRDLVAALRDAPDDLQCWTFLAAPTPKAMWARRQAHETTIHRVDAELAASSAVTPIDPALAADGVDELLACFITRRGSKLRAERGQTLAVQATDVDDRWVVAIGPDEPVTERHSEAAADCTIAGRAQDLYLTLWSRAVASDAGVSVAGDEAVFALFCDAVHVRWQ
jgi:uncharacterized protein (TIGR03083 family)